MFVIEYEEDTCNIKSLGEGDDLPQAMSKVLNVTATEAFKENNPSQVTVNYNGVEFDLPQMIIWLAHNMPESDPVDQLISKYESAQEEMKADLAEKANNMRASFSPPMEIVTAACILG